MTIDDTLEQLDLLDLADESETVRQTVSAIARLLGAPVGREPVDLPSFAAGRLHCAVSEVGIVTVRLPGIRWPLVRVEVARLLDGVSGAVLRDDTGRYAPGYELVKVGVDEQVPAPNDLAAHLPKGPVFDFDAVLVLSERRVGEISLRVRPADTTAARTALSQLVARAENEHNFLRGRTLRAQAADDGFELVPVRPAAADRSEVVHTAAVWRTIDTDIGGLRRHADALAAAGLGVARGVLIAGPPGVGKTALCRVIASELEPGTTVVLVEPGFWGGQLGDLYRAVGRLAPAAVFLDDIDLLGGARRGTGPSSALGNFLVHLDGFRPPGAVITVATTNAVDALDPALIRPGRFDTIVEVGAPDAGARARILHRYLDPVCELDVAPVVAVTEGYTGADLREIVRRAVLERGTDTTVAHLVEIARSGRWKPKPPTGQYL